jgi:hypothetical protein
MRMTNEASKPVLSASTDTHPFFPHNAAPQPPLEAAERQYADRPTGAPHWHPEEGDFN